LFVLLKHRRFTVGSRFGKTTNSERRLSQEQIGLSRTAIQPGFKKLWFRKKEEGGKNEVEKIDSCGHDLDNQLYYG
jgi:hypothetical protein